MDPRTAADHLTRAERARSAAESPRLPSGTPALAGVAVALGFLALALLPFSTAGWLTGVVVALALWAAAGWLVLRLRAAGEVRGLRGRGRTTAVVLAVCALSLVPAPLSTTRATRGTYLVLAVAGGLAMAVATRRRVDRG
ncbi:hypothetical protein [uncultured Friedmanniella sp.]|uniref:hypothetical protein n=1 Tax=uncultured Friedmanniella sp. TaxID=335381 RepID=UPI0035CC852A